MILKLCLDMCIDFEFKMGLAHALVKTICKVSRLGFDSPSKLVKFINWKREFTSCSFSSFVRDEKPSFDRS